jgi:hypothetical protein
LKVPRSGLQFQNLGFEGQAELKAESASAELRRDKSGNEDEDDSLLPFLPSRWDLDRFDSHTRR